MKNLTTEEIHGELHERILRLIGHIDIGAHLFSASLELWTGNSREAKG